MNDQNSLKIVLIEDNDLDVELIIRALRQNNLGNQIIRIADGQEALDFFFNPAAHRRSEGKELPKLILLDLKLPGINGIDILKALKSKEETRSIPVVILTSSTEEKDIEICYQLGVNSYISKPVELDIFMHTMKTLGLYWLLLNKTP